MEIFGNLLTDGHPTIITFSLDAEVKLAEVEVTPFGLDGGGEVDTTNMRRNTYRTQQPKRLISVSDGSLTVQYDPAVLDQILAMININQLITVTYSDGSADKVWGWINTFKPNGHKEGETPTAEIEMKPSNQNASFVETGPVHVTAAPTTTAA